MRTLPLIWPRWCLSEAALGRAVQQIHHGSHSGVNTSVNQINKSCTGGKHSPYLSWVQIHHLLCCLPGPRATVKVLSASGHSSSLCPVFPASAASASGPGVASYRLWRLSLVSRCNIARSGGHEKVRRSGGDQSHLTSRGLLLGGPGGCAAVGGGERGAGAGGSIAHLQGVINSWRAPAQLLSAVIDNSL